MNLTKSLAACAVALATIVAPSFALAQDFTASKNVWTEDGYRFHYTYGEIPTSYIHENGSGQLERVEYLDKELVVETINSKYSGASSHLVIDPSTYNPSNLSAQETLRWGGFYSGAKANYVLTGQTNSGENDGLVVMRVSKYDKSWNYLGAAELKGGNTTDPFAFGTSSMAEINGKLHVHTCHVMYKSPDGNNHQANVHMIIDMNSMDIVSADYLVTYTFFGYTSHSFNQKIAILGDKVYTLDHGDAYPRSISITNKSATESEVRGDILKIPGAIGDNKTGVSVGGFESSSTANTLLTVGNSANLSVGMDGIRNIWLTVTDPENLSSTTTRNLTNLSESGTASARVPYLIKINENRFLVMWGVNEDGEQKDLVYYQFVDGKGQSLGEVQSVKAYLSDCQPIVHNGKVVWYVSGGYYNNGSYATSDKCQPSLFYIDANTGEFAQSMRRLYNPNSGEHFYTMSLGESTYLEKQGWRYEGIGWTSMAESSKPVYRLYNPNGGDHHYTTSAGERDLLVAAGWHDEGTGWYSDSEGTAVYRQYNPNAKTGSHNYTTSSAERDMLVAAGWHDEGIGWYGVTL